MTNLPLTILRARATSTKEELLTPCKHCSKPFHKTRAWSLYCSTTCRNAYNKGLRELDSTALHEQIEKLLEENKELREKLENIELVMIEKEIGLT